MVAVAELVMVWVGVAAWAMAGIFFPERVNQITRMIMPTTTSRIASPAMK